MSSLPNRFVIPSNRMRLFIRGTTRVDATGKKLELQHGRSGADLLRHNDATRCMHITHSSSPSEHRLTMPDHLVADYA